MLKIYELINMNYSAYNGRFDAFHRNYNVVVG